MAIIVCGMAAVFLLDLYLTYEKGIYFSSYLTFDRAAILSGQFWRILSFIFSRLIPPLFLLFFLFVFIGWIGSALENQWGSFRFDLFYLCGILAYHRRWIHNGIRSERLFKSVAVLCIRTGLSGFPDHAVFPGSDQSKISRFYRRRIFSVDAGHRRLAE